MAKGIRSYGPGKFHTLIDSYAYELTMEGVDEEESYPEGGGWYGFLEVDRETRDRIREIAFENEDKLTEQEESMLSESLAIILFERSDGIVEVDWFQDIAEADEEWVAIQEGFEEMDEDEDDVLLADLDIDHEGFGPDEKNPTSGLRVVTSGSTVKITEWSDIEDATGEEQPEGEKIVRQYTEVELDELLDPKGKHRGAYSGDDKRVTIESLAEMDDQERENAIVAAAIAYMAYHGGDEEFVERIGD